MREKLDKKKRAQQITLNNYKNAIIIYEILSICLFKLILIGG